MAKPKYEYWLSNEGLILIQGWARDGLTDEQISHNMGISRSTLNKWKTDHSDISDTLKKGKEVVDREVENSLLNRALGGEVKEVTKEFIEGKMVVTKEVIKQSVGDTTAAIFWLKNRKPKEWRDKQVQEISGSVNTTIENPFKGMSKSDLRELLRDEQ